MKNFAILLSCVITLTIAPTLQGQVIVNEDFESYNSDSDLTTAWSGGAATLDTSLAFGGNKSAAHPAGTVNSFSAGIGTVNASTTKNLVLTGRIYDDIAAGNDRVTIGLRGGPFPLFEMGRYNSYDVATTAEFDVYGVRINSIGNGIDTPGDFTPKFGWVAFADSSGDGFASTEGWHTYEATFSLKELTVTLDLNSDGDIDGTITYAGDETGYGGGFTDLRFGGPSNLASAGGGANFDDIKLELVSVGGGLACDLDGDKDCDHDDIDDLYGNSPTTTEIATWLNDASDPSNTALVDPNDTLSLGDVNLNGDVDSADLGLLLNSFGSTSSPGWGAGNLNADANVDSADLGGLLNNFGFTSALAVSSVPEPNGLLCVFIGLASIFAIRRQR